MDIRTQSVASSWIVAIIFISVHLSLQYLFYSMAYFLVVYVTIYKRHLRSFK